MESMKFDLAATPLREVNQFLHKEATPGLSVQIDNPNGAHAIAAGMNADVSITVEGHAGYYAAGMNQIANVTINGSAGTGVAENMMSGKVHVKGFASNAAGATAQGGLLVIDGDAGLREGPESLKDGFHAVCAWHESKELIRAAIVGQCFLVSADRALGTGQRHRCARQNGAGRISDRSCNSTDALRKGQCATARKHCKRQNDRAKPRDRTHRTS